jgi:hypothetical protein
MIVRHGKQFTVMSESGRRMGTYRSRKRAQRRLRQIEMFKRMKSNSRSRLIARNRADHGQAAFDYFTPFHFAAGFAAGVLGVSPVKAAIALTALKVGIASYERGAGHALFSRGQGESNLNELCDLLAELAGVDIGAQIRARSSASASPPAPAPAPAPPLPAAPVAGFFR